MGCQRPRLITMGWLILFLDSIIKNLDLDTCEGQYVRDVTDMRWSQQWVALVCDNSASESTSPSHKTRSLFYLLGAHGRVAEKLG